MLKHRPELPVGKPMLDGALAPWKIVAIAQSKGEFRVSWRYRDERLMRRCNKLHRQGWLKRVRCAPGETLFAYRPEPKPTEVSDGTR